MNDSFSNVLVSCGGKWAGMVAQLAAAQRRVPQLARGKLIVAANVPLTPAGMFADASVVVPAIAASEYIDAMLAVCREQHVRVLVPLIDVDVVRLAPHRQAFAAIGTTVICPSPEMVELGFDKQLFAEFVAAAGLPYPRTYAVSELATACYPLFYKSQRGFGSLAVGVCRTPGEAQSLLSERPDLIFQEVISAPELSVDAYLARSGKCIVCVPRVRDKVIGGEAYQSHTVRESELHHLAMRTLEALAQRGLRGPVNVQLFGGQRPVLIEINTRLGSASVLSNHASDGRLFDAVLREACGESVDGDPYDYQPDLYLHRYLGDVFFAPGGAPLVVPGAARP